MGFFTTVTSMWHIVALFKHTEDAQLKPTITNDSRINIRAAVVSVSREFCTVCRGDKAPALALACSWGPQIRPGGC